MEGVRSVIFILLIAAVGSNAHVHLKLTGHPSASGDDSIVFEYPKKGGSYSGSGSFSSSNSASYASSNSGSFSFNAGVTPGAVAGTGFGNGANSYGGTSGGSVAGVGGFISAGSLTGAGLHLGMIPLGSGAGATNVNSGSKIHSNTDAGHSAGSIGIAFGSGAGGSTGTYDHGSTLVNKEKEVPIKFVASAAPTQETQFVEKTPVTGQAGISISTLPVHSHTAAPGGKVDSYGNPIGSTNFNLYGGSDQSQSKYPESKLTLGSGGSVSGFHADSAAGSNAGSVGYAPTQTTIIKPTSPSYVAADSNQPGIGGSGSFGFGGSQAGSASSAGSYNTQTNVKPAIILETPSQHSGGFGGSQAGSAGSAGSYNTQSNIKPATVHETPSQYSVGFGGSQAGSSSSAGSYNTQTNVKPAIILETPSHYGGGFGGASGVLGEQTKPGYAIGMGIHTENHQHVKPQTTPTTTTHYAGNFGGSSGILGHQEKPGFAVGIQSGSGSQSGVLVGGQGSTSVPEQSHYSGGFGGAAGVLGQQPKPGYAVGSNANAGAHSGMTHGVVITMGTHPHGVGSHTGSGGVGGGSTYYENSGHYGGSFGGAPGIITATGPATNYYTPAKGPVGSVGMTVHQIHVQNTPAPTLGIIMSTGAHSKPTSGLVIHGTNQYQGSHATSGAAASGGSYGIGGGQNVNHHYSGTYGGAPGIITATGPAPNHPTSGTVIMTTTAVKPSTGSHMIISGTVPSLMHPGGLLGGGLQGGHGGSVGLLTGSGVNTAGSGDVNSGTYVKPTSGGTYGGGFGLNHGFASAGASASAGSFSGAGSGLGALGANGHVHEIDVGGPYGNGNGLYTYGSGGQTLVSSGAVASAGAGATAGPGFYGHGHGHHGHSIKGKIGGDSGFGGAGSHSKAFSFGVSGLHGGIGIQSHSDFQGGDYKWRNYGNGGAKGVTLFKNIDGGHPGGFSTTITGQTGTGLYSAHSDHGNSGGLFGKSFKIFK